MKTTTEMQLVPITKLVPYVNNARTHSPEQINKLCSHSTSCFKVICLGLRIFYSHSLLQILCNTHFEYIFYYTHTRYICQAFRK